MIGLPGWLRHDEPVRAFWRSAGAAACIVALAGSGLLSGCGVLSGRSTSDISGTPTVGPATSSAPVNTSGAKFTDAAAVSSVLSAAEHDFETVFTYDYRNLAKYRSEGLKVTTSPYSTTYGNALQGKLGQRLVSTKSVQVATSQVSGIASLTSHATYAKVIVHGTITTTSAADPTGSPRNVTAVLIMRKISGSWRISATKTGAAAVGSIPADSKMRQAIAATRLALVRIYGLHRSSFEADYRRAVAFTTDTLRATMTRQKVSLQATLVTGKYDLSAKIVGVAAMQPKTGTSFIIEVDEYRVGRQSAKLGPYPHILLVNTALVNGKWLIRSATPLN